MKYFFALFSALALASSAALAGDSPTTGGGTGSGSNTTTSSLSTVAYSFPSSPSLVEALISNPRAFKVVTPGGGVGTAIVFSENGAPFTMVVDGAGTVTIYDGDASPSLRKGSDS